MMTLSFIRAFFLIISGAVGYYIGSTFGRPLYGAQIGCLCALLLIFTEGRLRRVSVRGLSSMVFGLLLGLFMAKLIADILTLLPLGEFIQSVSRVVLTIIFSYLGAVMALRGKDEFNIIIPYVKFRRQDVEDRVILLDTSVIIDGRVAKIYKSKFLSGRLVVARSVLQELQKLADSADEQKRQKGKRGLELLKEMQRDPDVEITIHEDDLKTSQSVDERLIELAKVMDASVCTNDFNMGEIAALQGVDVLNIHQIADALRSEVSEGEEFNVRLMKEGTEEGQAVGYLKDGTMVVVNQAKEFIGSQKEVKVTSVLQTQSGKMIFAELT